jgi:hypothetical protein
MLLFCYRSFARWETAEDRIKWLEIYVRLVSVAIPIFPGASFVHFDNAPLPTGAFCTVSNFPFASQDLDQV